MQVVNELNTLLKKASSSPYELWAKTVQESQICSFSGVLTGETISSLLQLLDSYLKSNNAISRRKKNTVNVLIECLQNMYYHNSTLHLSGQTINGCFISIHRDSNDIIIKSCNLVNFEKIVQLTNQIERLNAMTPLQVHQHYLEILDKGLLSPLGGAGLGLIRIIKESGSPLKFSFNQAQNNIWFFNLSLRILQVFSDENNKN
jgi:hypothetical protein